MLYKGVLITQASGRVDDVVFSHNRGGPYIRSLGNPNPHTASDEQINQRAAFKASFQLWNDLAEDERELWRQSGRDNPTVNRLGDTRPIDGISALVRSVFYRYHLNALGIFTNIPTLPPAVVEVPWDSSWLHSIAYNTGDGFVYADLSGFDTDEDTYILWYTGDPIPLTRKFYKSPMTLSAAGTYGNDYTTGYEVGIVPSHLHAKQRFVATWPDGSFSRSPYIDLDLPTA